VGNGLNLPLTALNPVANLTEDGKVVFFQTSERLVGTDVGATQDVYRWKDGDLALVSSGHSPLITQEPPFGSGQPVPTNFLYAVSPDGSDVMIVTNDQLLPQDATNGSGAIYDARVDGGFPQGNSGPGPCSGDACQGSPTLPPAEPVAGSSSFFGPGNQHRRHKRCDKHRRLKHGKCVKKKKARESK
jgi:hypothetical protein